MSRNQLLYIDDILESISAVESHLQGITEAQFAESVMVQDAVIRRFLVIGEAAARLSDEFKEKHSEVAWHKIIGMRNRLVHDYLRITLAVLWETAIKDLPELKKSLQKILESSN